MKCEYCGNHLPYEVSSCPSCGASCQYIPRPEEKTAAEVSESQEPKPKKTRVPISDVNVDFLEKNRQAHSKNSGCASVIIILIFAIVFSISAFAMA